MLASVNASNSNLQYPSKDSIPIFKPIKKKRNYQYDLYLLGGLSLSNQQISIGNYNSNFNYELADNNRDELKPGYFAGFRLDSKERGSQNYSFEMLLSKCSTGTNYKDVGNLTPFLGSYSRFKADDQFLTLSTAAHFRQLILFGDTSKLKFYIIAGPSFETRLSAQSDDNLIHNNYHRFNLRGDLGLELDSHSNFTVFVHYKRGLTSFTKDPIKTTLNSVNIGVLIKASNLF